MRQSIGTAVFGGMIGVTIFGLMFTPAFYAFIRSLGSGSKPANEQEPAPRKQEAA
jgi:Cu/Ag efflux pump CusA